MMKRDAPGVHLRKPAYILLLVFLVTPDCVTSPITKRAARFSSAASLAVVNSKAAYDAVQTSYYETPVSALIVNYDKTGFDPTPKTVLPDGSIFIRLADCTTKQMSKSEFAKTEGSKISPEGNPPSSPTGIGGSGEGLMPMAPAPEVLDPAMKQKYREALNGYYAYRIVGYVHRERVFKWQLFSSKIIFAVVLLLVCSGIYFAALSSPPAQTQLAESKRARLKH